MSLCRLLVAHQALLGLGMRPNEDNQDELVTCTSRNHFETSMAKARHLSTMDIVWFKEPGSSRPQNGREPHRNSYPKQRNQPKSIKTYQN